jgi:predicted ABC-type ATPase
VKTIPLPKARNQSLPKTRIMLRLSNAAGQLYASFGSRASLTAKVAGFGRIFPPTCKKARIATSAVDDPQNDGVAGPPGSGKSTLYPVSSFGVSYFNADDRAAELNGGSYVSISNEIRKVFNREFEAFVLGAIEKRIGFAIETTLRGDVTFEHARLAKQAGFVVEMRYLALRDFASHLERVKVRADAGGHSVSETTLRRIDEARLRNLRRAVLEMDILWVYDNTSTEASHPLVLEARNGEICFLSEEAPSWLTATLDLF